MMTMTEAAESSLSCGFLSSGLAQPCVHLGEATLGQRP
jgi:hypothetical protein